MTNSDIHVVRQPSIYVLGRQTVNDAELDRFLSDHGVSWQSDSEIAAEVLCETAGRVCYLSFAKPRPGGNAAYLGHIKESGHGSVLEHAVWNLLITGISRSCCYDAKTDVLTREGWVPWPQVRGDEEFASLTGDGKLVYEHAVKKFVGHYCGKMYRVQSEQIDLTVTPNHRMYIQPYDTQACRRGEQPYMILTAEEIVNRRVRYAKSATWVGRELTTVAIPATSRAFSRVLHGHQCHQTRHYAGAVFDADTFLRFLGYFVSEGCLDRADQSVRLFQNTAEPVADRIRETLTRMKVAWGECPNGSRNSQFHFKCVSLYDWLKKEVPGGAKLKRVPEFVQRLSPRQIRLFLESMIDGDGSRRNDGNHCVYYTVSEQLADDVQILAMKAGWAANIRIDDRVGMKRTIKQGDKLLHFRNNFPCFVVSICKTRVNPLVNHCRAKKGPLGKSGHVRPFGRNDDGFVNYDGIVYCVQVPSGLLYVRRNGKPCWSGNTHELIRHRAGVGVSQLSQRYVDESVAEYVEPDVIADDPELHALWLDAIRHVHAAYVTLATKLAEKMADEPDRTARRKAARQAARSVLPNATETKIFITANARALRNIIEQRGSRHAEPEIRKLAVALLDVLQRESPNLFDDYTRVALPDGSVEVTTPFRKV